MLPRIVREIAKAVDKRDKHTLSLFDLTAPAAAPAGPAAAAGGTLGPAVPEPSSATPGAASDPSHGGRLHKEKRTFGGQRPHVQSVWVADPDPGAAAPGGRAGAWAHLHPASALDDALGHTTEPARAPRRHVDVDAVAGDIEGSHRDANEQAHISAGLVSEFDRMVDGARVLKRDEALALLDAARMPTPDLEFVQVGGLDVATIGSLVRRDVAARVNKAVDGRRNALGGHGRARGAIRQEVEWLKMTAPPLSLPSGLSPSAVRAYASEARRVLAQHLGDALALPASHHALMRRHGVKVQFNVHPDQIEDWMKRQDGARPSSPLMPGFRGPHFEDDMAGYVDAMPDHHAVTILPGAMALDGPDVCRGTTLVHELGHVVDDLLKPDLGRQGIGPWGRGRVDGGGALGVLSESMHGSMADEIDALSDRPASWEGKPSEWVAEAYRYAYRDGGDMRTAVGQDKIDLHKFVKALDARVASALDGGAEVLKGLPVKVAATKVKRAIFPYKGEIIIHGLPRILVEQRKGDIRRGVDPDGHAWAVTQPAHYGEFEGTVGADGDPVDVYVGDDAGAPFAYVVPIRDLETGKYDEDKVYVGFNSLADVLAKFRLSYDKPGFRIARVRKLSIPALAAWIATPGNRGKRIEVGQEMHKAAAQMALGLGDPSHNGLLHEEKRTDRTGRTQTRWLANGKVSVPAGKKPEQLSMFPGMAPEVPTAAPAAPAATGAPGTLYERFGDRGAPKPGEKGYRATSAERAAAEERAADIFDTAASWMHGVDAALVHDAMLRAWGHDGDGDDGGDPWGVAPEDLPDLLGWPEASVEDAADTLQVVMEATDPMMPGRWRRGQVEAIIADTMAPAGPLRLVNVSIDEAMAFIKEHHSAMPVGNPRGLMYAIGVKKGGRLVAVATAGTPTGRWKDPHKVLELTRIASDGTVKNASSKLAARLLDLAPKSTRDAADDWLFVTYSLASERGTTYRALREKGLRPVARVRGKAGGGGGNRSGNLLGYAADDKIRWEAGPMAAEAKWEIIDD